MIKKKNSKYQEGKKETAKNPSASICVNKDCKLRKQKKCAGFEACPGFQGR